MPQVRNSCSCGISAIFFKVFFYDWNPSSNDNVSFFRVFFLGIMIWKETSFFSGEGGSFFRWGRGGFIFKLGGHGGVALVLMDWDWKNHRMGGGDPSPPALPPHYVKPWLCNPPTFNITKTSESIELLPLFVDDRKVFTVKVKANIARFWQCDEFSAIQCDPIKSGKWN